MQLYPWQRFNLKLQSPLSGHALNSTCADAFWGDSHFNFSFTPRSVCYFLYLGLSIQLRSNIRHHAVGPLLTFGFRPTLEYFSHSVSQYALWNRRYLDYFVAIPTTGQVTLTFQTADHRAMLQSAIALLHPANHEDYFCCHGLNALLDRAESSWWRLFHLPVPRQLYEQVTQGAVWAQIPRQLWQGMARARLYLGTFCRTLFAYMVGSFWDTFLASHFSPLVWLGFEAWLLHFNGPTTHASFGHIDVGSCTLMGLPLFSSSSSDFHVQLLYRRQAYVADSAKSQDFAFSPGHP